LRFLPKKRAFLQISYHFLRIFALPILTLALFGHPKTAIFAQKQRFAQKISRFFATFLSPILKSPPSSRWKNRVSVLTLAAIEGVYSFIFS